MQNPKSLWEGTDQKIRKTSVFESILHYYHLYAKHWRWRSDSHSYSLILLVLGFDTPLQSDSLVLMKFDLSAGRGGTQIGKKRTGVLLSFPEITCTPLTPCV